MANPFFSGRIPPALAIQIDAHLMITGETRSELLVRLLRSEISDNKSNNTVDNKPDNMISVLLSRVERLEKLVDNNIDNKTDIKTDSIAKHCLEQVEIASATEIEPEVVSLNMESLAKRLKVSEKRLRASAASDESWQELMEATPDPESLQWSRPVKVGSKWRIDCLASI